MLDMESESDFYQEYPSNPLESFISTGNAVFNQTKVLNRLTYANEPIDKREVRSNLPESIRQWASKGIVLFDYPQRTKNITLA